MKKRISAQFQIVLQQIFSYLQRGPAVLLQCWCVQLAIALQHRGEDCNLPPGETEMQRGAAAVKYEGHKSPEHETWGRAADCRQNRREHASILRSHEDYLIACKSLTEHCSHKIRREFIINGPV